MNQVHREIIRTIKRVAPGVQFKVLRQRVHVVFRITYNDQVAQGVCATSPKNSVHMVRNACADIRKKLNLPKVV